jgi:hypothetical protein
MQTDNKKAMPTSWETAKALLQQDIFSGMLQPTMRPKEVYSMRVEYKEVEYKKFRANLNSLRKACEKLSARAMVDSAAVAHDWEVHPIQKNVLGVYPRWDGSEAQRLLKIDVQNGKNNAMAPCKLRMTREEYNSYPVDVFRKHIHQEVRSHRVTAYWLARKQEKINSV